MASATRSGVNAPSRESVPRTVTDTARMPSGARVVSRLRTRLRTPAFCTPSDAASFHGLSAAMLPVTVIRPPSPRNGRAACTAVSRAPTPRATSSSSSRTVSCSGSFCRKALGLKCSTSMRPKYSPSSVTAVVHASTSVMSATTASTSTPPSRRVAARSSSSVLSIPSSPTSYPSRAKRRATEPLTPGPAPTTTTMGLLMGSPYVRGGPQVGVQRQAGVPPRDQPDEPLDGVLARRERPRGVVRALQAPLDGLAGGPVLAVGDVPELHGVLGVGQRAVVPGQEVPRALDPG